MVKIAPSILAANFEKLEEEIKSVVDAGADMIHVDVMDAHFVPNLAFGPDTVRRLREITRIPLDVHLMMDNPEQYLDIFLDAGADILTVHAEIEGDLRGLLRRIREKGRRAGLALKPGTGLEQVEPLIPDTDLMLCMTVEPGFGGQPLNEKVLEKMAALREMGYAGEIEADGGIREENLLRLIQSGLTAAVMGTGLYRAEDPAATMRRLHGMG